MELKIRVVLKSAMQKSRAHKGHRYAFGGLITELCHNAGVPIKGYDYFPHIKTLTYMVKNVQGPEMVMRTILTTVERFHRDEHIMARMYRLEMLRQKTGSLLST